MSVRSLFASQDEATLLTIDNEKYFIIDGESRSITPPADFKNFGVESDENAKRVYFKCPRIVGDNLDLTALNLRVNYQNAKGEKDKYIVTDVVSDGNYVHFSWLLSRKCNMYSGIISFIVCAVKTDDAGIIKNEWNTTLCTGVVLGGLEVENPEIPEDTVDLVNQLVDIINNSISEAESKSAEAIENIKAAEEEAIENIGNILDDTLKVKGKAADASAVGDELNTKADIILRSAFGESIIVNDSANIRLQGLKLFGKSEQLGTPTPESPVEIVSIENPTITIDEQSIALPYTLHGIPVESGGNYTDANGQQYICDEIDFARDIYIQRVGKCVLTGIESFEDFVAEYNTVTLAIAHKDNTEILCSHSGYNSAVMWANTSRIKFVIKKFGVSTFSEFKNTVINNYENGTPITILYVLPAPIETPLSEAKIAAFKALHSNKPTTTILNDKGAYMEVKYAADIENYISARLNVLEERIKALESGV